MQFFADELEVGSLMGCVSGECELSFGGNGFSLQSVDWVDALFCDSDGEPVELTDSQRQDVAAILCDVLECFDPADAGSVIHLGRNHFSTRGDKPLPVAFVSFTGVPAAESAIPVS